MKKILLICVNYNSYDVLQTFLQSVDNAAQKVKEEMKADVAIADNSPEKQPINNTYSNLSIIDIHKNDNVGYLGGALPLYNQWAQNYDFVSISNVDLRLKEDFFANLIGIDITDIGWLAPSILTQKNNTNENPFMTHRPQKRNFVIWNIIYSNTLIHNVYKWLSVKKHQWLAHKQKKTMEQEQIYAGHGSLMLFTSAFVKQNQHLHYPNFMYGEEIYFAELVRQSRLEVVYHPQLTAYNIGGVSTLKVSHSIRSQWSKKSVQTLEKMFFL